MALTKEELIEYNVGENLDSLMNLDPRGYGVCRILYKGSRDYTGEPLSIHSAKELMKVVKPGDPVFIFVGFILIPHKCPETDGMVSIMMLARALVQAFGAKPIIVCPEESARAVEQCAGVVGLHCYRDIKTVMELPLSMGVVAFTKIKNQARQQAEQILSQVTPAAAISVECSGSNEEGVYHTALGFDVTDLEAKSDMFWEVLREKGVPTVAIGDLGNENGMAVIADHIKKYVPYTDKDQCQDGCKGGILAHTGADNIITATCSDWGCYALMAAISYLKRDKKVMPPEEMPAEVMRVLCRHNIVDMTGSLLPGVDGFDLRLNVLIMDLMRQVTRYAIRYEDPNDNWFGPVLKKGFFESHK